MNNLQIVKERTKLFNAFDTPRVGDYLKLPNDLGFTRFTHEWDESIQTGGGTGSFYLGKSGGVSYSGGLDSGVSKKDIVPTIELKKGFIWIFDEGISGAHRGKDFEIDFRVYELIKNADTSGLPQIERAIKQAIRDCAETITRTNGNGQEYTLPIPELLIQLQSSKNLDKVVKDVKDKTGLLMELAGGCNIRVQPLTVIQSNIIENMLKFESTYYNNGDTKNTLFLKEII